ncbi:lysozyme g-like isoform X2 [Brachyhypopomus gauderio]|uniref:lysozyme g-like isoform X2 n=1 Tax=Brachyhypopomus gauderio TaxID=698409 RepID=UPI00404199A6
MALSVNINDIPTTGAGAHTSRQLGNRQLTSKTSSHLLNTGTDVQASYALAEEDAGRMENYRRSINKAAEETHIDPAIIAAIISRETRAGNYLGRYGWNSQNIAFGIMQVHKVNNPRGAKDSLEHMIQACGILTDYINIMDVSWSPELRYKGGIAAYNCGPRKVTSTNVDRNTEGGDYANDVVARAQWYKSKGY